MSAMMIMGTEPQPAESIRIFRPLGRAKIPHTSAPGGKPRSGAQARRQTSSFCDNALKNLVKKKAGESSDENLGREVVAGAPRGCKVQVRGGAAASESEGGGGEGNGGGGGEGGGGDGDGCGGGGVRTEARAKAAWAMAAAKAATTAAARVMAAAAKTAKAA